MLSSGPLRLALLCALLAVGAMVGTTAASDPPASPNPPASPSHRASSEPRCFGAASLDPSKPCHNPRLGRLVVPPPAVARHRPNAPCTVIGVEDSLKLCAFGAPRTHASATVALVGDSHAENWRGAVAHVARAKGWYGISIALGGCPYSSITRTIDEPLRSHCAERNRDVPRWFESHPEVHTVLVAQISGVPFDVPAGMSQFEGQVQAYLDAWNALPASVEHIVVIRDSPKALPRTRHCVQAAIAAGRPAGLRCRMPRTAVVDPDAAVAAAQRLGSPRVQVVNLLEHFCDRRWCYPVVGGALVQKDLNHLSATFIETLGPYLLRDVDRLLPS